MTEDEIIRFAGTLPDVTVVTASADNGAPEIAWGDSFFHYGEDRMFPFATLVIKDYPGFDEASQIDRPGVFRLNVNVGRQRFEELFRQRPADHVDGVDCTELDTLFPHPVYGHQAWVSVLNPADRTADLVRSLLAEAHARTAARGHPARPDQPRGPGQAS